MDVGTTGETAGAVFAVLAAVYSDLSGADAGRLASGNAAKVECVKEYDNARL